MEPEPITVDELSHDVPQRRSGETSQCVQIRAHTDLEEDVSLFHAFRVRLCVRELQYAILQEEEEDCSISIA